jgi:hypothetical protein
METIRSRPGLRRYHARDGPTEFRGVVLRCDLHFGNCVQIWIDHSDTDDRILVVCAVQFVSGRERQLAVHFNLLALLRVLILPYAPADVGCARR